ncbi:ABC transporter ATP-binding protein [Actinobacillus equuli]|nr:ABC transporter ATP-binding protein [Actinobacillus equuli]
MTALLKQLQLPMLVASHDQTFTRQLADKTLYLQNSGKATYANTQENEMKLIKTTLTGIGQIFLQENGLSGLVIVIAMFLVTGR